MRCDVIVAGVLAVASSAWAQAVPYDMTGEFAAYFGPASGPGSAHLSVGGSTAAAVGRWAMAGFDVAYTPIDDASLRWLSAGTVIRNSRLYDFNANLRIRVPVGLRRTQWYGILGAGLLHNSFQSATPAGSQSLVFTSGSTDNFAFQTGGGLRYYVGEGWGVRPELRVVVSAKNYVLFSLGVFTEVSALDWFRGRGFGGRKGRYKVR
jgi:hypothetical protein